MIQLKHRNLSLTVGNRFSNDYSVESSKQGNIGNGNFRERNRTRPFALTCWSGTPRVVGLVLPVSAFRSSSEILTHPSTQQRSSLELYSLASWLLSLSRFPRACSYDRQPWIPGMKCKASEYALPMWWKELSYIYYRKQATYLLCLPFVFLRSNLN